MAEQMPDDGEDIYTTSRGATTYKALRFETQVWHAPPDDLRESVAIVRGQDRDADEREVARRGRGGREHRRPAEAVHRRHRGAQLARGRHGARDHARDVVPLEIDEDAHAARLELPQQRRTLAHVQHRAELRPLEGREPRRQGQRLASRRHVERDDQTVSTCVRLRQGSQSSTDFCSP